MTDQPLNALERELVEAVLARECTLRPDLAGNSPPRPRLDTPGLDPTLVRQERAVRALLSARIGVLNRSNPGTVTAQRDGRGVEITLNCEACGPHQVTLATNDALRLASDIMMATFPAPISPEGS